MRYFSLSVLTLVSLSQGLAEAEETQMSSRTETLRFELSGPSENSWGSIPIGNGDIGLNVWVDHAGDLVFYIGKTDAWSENARLLKLGRVRLHFSPGFPEVRTHPERLRQTLDMENGEYRVEFPDTLRAAVWVDANHPVVQVEMESREPQRLQAELEIWRRQRRPLGEAELFSAYGLQDGPQPVVVEADRVLENGEERVVWCHRNERSIWEQNLQLQGLGSLAPNLKDPLFHRTFGGCVQGMGLVRDGTASLRSREAARRFNLSVFVLTAQTETQEEYLERLDAAIQRVEKIPSEERRQAHRNWWKEFWNRSWIELSGGDEQEAVSLGYRLQRHVNACGGRGAHPIKFNGSIFTVDLVEPIGRVPSGLDADYRSWGGPYWFQNTRLPYWSMLAGGDFDSMRPLFQMFLDALPLAKARTPLYYGHPGAFFPETLYFWGTYANDNYGWDRQGKPDGLTDNRYLRYYWSSGLELCLLMLDSFQWTGDRQFVTNTLLPLADPVVTFFDQHWQRDEDGKIRFDPAQSLETWHVATNPLPEIAGLGAVLSGLLDLPEDLTLESQRSNWRRLLGELPPIPTREVQGEEILAPAEAFSDHKNSENPELYAVFPYRIYQLGKPGVDLARRTFERRMVKGTGGWRQDAIQAALLGLTDEAARCVVENFSAKHPGFRFPAFWGPNFDWVPDQDHGSVAAIALQKMLMQSAGEKILLFPAWPKDWDVDFRLHAPFNTTVEGNYRNGNLMRLAVNPPHREKDIVRMDRQAE